jgi:hypothetical protein
MIMGILYTISCISAADSLQINQIIDHPVMDGIADDYYGPEEAINVLDSTAPQPDDQNDCSGNFKCGWIDDSLYIHMDILDDILDTDNNGEPWENDGIEMYFDGDNSKLKSSYDQINDIQIRIERDDSTNNQLDYVYGNSGANPWFDVSSLRFKILENEDTGYFVEICNSISALKITGDENDYYGFDIQVNDADGSARESIFRWHCDNHEGWHNASALGNAVFLASSIVTNNNKMPESYALFQNYPNPFNPVTMISFQLPEKSQVIISIYNIAGEKILDLFRGYRQAGIHSITWDASAIASGTYFIRMQSENFIKIVKSILIK